MSAEARTGELELIAEQALEIARRAGALLQSGHTRGLAVSHKGAVDLVTEQDLRSQALVVAALGEAFPAHAVRAEEGAAQEPDGAWSGAAQVGRSGEAAATNDRPVWLVDPLDGTTNYAHGLPFYAVSLALEEHEVPLVGVVLAPELGWELCAWRGGGAYCNGERLRVSEAVHLGDALLATGFPYDRQTALDNNVPEFAAVLRRAQGIRRVGSASLDCAMVARGVLDGYWEYKLKPWDIAAGALLVLEAGGRVTDAELGPYRSRTGHLLASNGGPLHEELHAILREVRGSAAASRQR